jgi:HPt (histidine-containing phosphotransfer) domain-containing protein
MAEGRGVDPSYLQDLAESGGEAFVRDVVRTFLETVPPRVATLRAALGTGDYAAASRAAHSIVSSAATVGLIQVQETAREVESLTAQGGLVPSQQLLALDRALAEAPELLEQTVRAVVRERPSS